ncbi:MAG: DNA polymerase III subunit beta [Candidatus Berkelbacteria bacterium Licking1014_7]|uniref:Beta sliding clamp n=1 Tax=Candidatus Berkelbacteria bacterium Licking1014_7 TaxID=2017147 RepID=A0A554LJ78_9BACT|nr:MAG: DNA polymerase III subunit beta [Candidatus Berkelbacteria bacterium Licking1014_7]
MKFTCTQENLSKALNIVSHICTTRSTLPILSNVLFSIEKGRLKISSTDLEIGISTFIGAKIDEEGSFTVPSRLLVEFVNTNTDKNIAIYKEGDKLNLLSEQFNARIKGLEADEFPSIPDVKPDNTIEVSGALLSEAISQTVFATAIDDNRPVLTGVLCKVENDLLKIVATDSFRLAEKTVNLAKKSDKNFQFLVPARTFQELSRLLSEKIESVKIFISSNQVQFCLSDAILISRLIAGEYPDYTQIIPNVKKTSILAPRQELSNAIKMASFFAREANNNVKVKVGDKNDLQIVATSAQMGDNVSKTQAKIEGEAIEISFNAKYLLDPLGVIDELEVIFDLNGRFSPGVIKPVKAKDYLYIIMPLRLEE